MVIKKRQIIRFILALLIIFIIFVCSIFAYWCYCHYYTIYRNFKIENVKIEKIILDSTKSENKTYLLTIQCKRCNAVRRWGGILPSCYDGINEKINSVAIIDYTDKDITSYFMPVSKYKDISLGYLYFEGGNSTVRNAIKLNTLGNYLNNVTDRICEYRYSIEDSSYYFSMMYQIKDYHPKEMILKMNNKTILVKIPSKTTQVNVSCIIPQNHENDFEASAISN